MSHRFQKVSGRIHSENQTPKRPFVYCRGYPSPPPVYSRRFRTVCVWRVQSVHVWFVVCECESVSEASMGFQWHSVSLPQRARLDRVRFPMSILSRFETPAKMVQG